MKRLVTCGGFDRRLECRLSIAPYIHYHPIVDTYLSHYNLAKDAIIRQ